MAALNLVELAKVDPVILFRRRSSMICVSSQKGQPPTTINTQTKYTQLGTRLWVQNHSAANFFNLNF